MVTSIVEETEGVYIRLGCGTIKRGEVLNWYSLHIETKLCGTMHVTFDEFEFMDNDGYIGLFMRGHGVLSIWKESGADLYNLVKKALKRALEEWSDELPGWVYEGVSEVANPYRVEV